MAEDFAATVSAWVLKSERRQEAVFKKATEYTFDDVFENWPVDTGYSRGSFTASTTGPQPLTGRQGDGYSAPPYQLVIAGATLRDTIWGTFVANYAPHIEYGARGRAGLGIVRMAAQNWQSNVNRAVAEAQARVR